MKRSYKIRLVMGILLLLSHAYGQGSGAKEPLKKTTGTVNSAVAIEVKNKCEKPITIFAGRRQDLKSPKTKEKVYGGLSTNTLYVSINEVVCIVNDQGKPGSCIDVKSGMVELEINSSGNVITAK